MQKMEAFVQKMILQKLYNLDEVEEKRLFEKVTFLFRKNIAFDLYKEYAKPKVNMPIKDYLELMKQNFLNPLKGLIPDDEIKAMDETIESKIVKPSILKLPTHVDSPVEHKEGVMVREAQRATLKTVEKQKIGLNLTLQTQLDENERSLLAKIELDDRHPFDEKTFSNNFQIEVTNIDQLKKLKYTKPCIVPLNEVLQQQLGTQEKYFDDQILVTTDFISTIYNRFDVVGAFRKLPFQLLLICNEDKEGSKHWQIVMGSIAESELFRELLKNAKPGETIPDNRKVWLIRPNGKSVGTGPYPLTKDVIEDSDVKRLLSQFLFWNGSLYQLNQPNWSKTFTEWLSDKPKEKYQGFLEKNILRGSKPPGFERSRIGQTLR